MRQRWVLLILHPNATSSVIHDQITTVTSPAAAEMTYLSFQTRDPNGRKCAANFSRQHKEASNSGESNPSFYSKVSPNSLSARSGCSLSPLVHQTRATRSLLVNGIRVFQMEIGRDRAAQSRRGASHPGAVRLPRSGAPLRRADTDRPRRSLPSGRTAALHVRLQLSA